MPLIIAAPSSPVSQIGLDLACTTCHRGYLSDVEADLVPGLPCPGCHEDAEDEAIAAQAEVVLRAAPRWVWAIVDETLSKDAQSRAFSPELRREIHEAIIGMVIAEEDQGREFVSRQDAVSRLEALGFYQPQKEAVNG